MNYTKEDDEKRMRIFQNEKKTEKSADYKGYFTINGVDYEVSLWKHVSKAGKPYLGGPINEAGEYLNKHATTQAASNPVAPASRRQTDDEIPF